MSLHVKIGVLLLSIFVLLILSVGGIYLLDGESTEMAVDKTDEIDNKTGNNSSGDNWLDTGGEINADEVQPEATIEVSIEIYDLGVPEEGEIQLVNESSQEIVSTHEIANSPNTTFEGLDPDHQYQIKIDTPVTPPETFSFNPTAEYTEELFLEIGDEFQKADSFAADWVVSYESGVTLEKGRSVVDSRGNYFVSWEDPATPERYNNFHSAKADNTYTNFGTEGWEDRNQDIDPDYNPPSVIGLYSIFGVEDREYIGEVDPYYNLEVDHPVHEYEINGKEVNGELPITVHIDPETGYALYASPHVEKEGSDVTRSETWYRTHDEEVDAIPDDPP